MKSLNIANPNILNFLAYSFPLSFILGNLFINIVTLLIILFGFYIYKEKLFDFKKDSILTYIFLFFVLLLISTIIENNENHIIKSVLFLRYFFLLLVLRCMIINGDLNIKKFFLICLTFSIIISLDVIFQYFVGVNIFGQESTIQHRSSFFGSEKIAGGYIQRFLILGLFSIPLFLSKNKKKLFIILGSITTIGFIGIILSGNRMPAILFIFFIILSLIFNIRKFKFVNVLFLIFTISFLSLLIIKNENLKNHYENFYAGIKQFSKIIPEIKKEYPELEKYKNSGKQFQNIQGFIFTPQFQQYHEKYDVISVRSGHTATYITSIDLLKESPVIGRGIKSFRNNCREKWHLPNRMCQNHPHHFYLEIINDTGIIGFLLLGISLVILLLKNFKYYYLNVEKKLSDLNLAFYAISFTLIIEFFPLRSHGSFFSTYNSSFIFFIIGIFYGLYELKLKKFEKR